MNSDVSDTSTEDWTLVNSIGAELMENSCQTTVSSASDISVEPEADNLVNAVLDTTSRNNSEQEFRNRVHSETRESVGSCCSEFTRLSSASGSSAELSCNGDECTQEQGEALDSLDKREPEKMSNDVLPGKQTCDTVAPTSFKPRKQSLEELTDAGPSAVRDQPPSVEAVVSHSPAGRIEEADDSEDDQLSIINLIGDSCSAGAVVEIDEYAMQVAASAGYPLHLGHPRPGLKIRRLSSTAGPKAPTRKESDESSRDDSFDEQSDESNEEELFSEELPVNWVQQCSNSIHNYIHTCNPPLNWKLTSTCVLVTALVIGLGVGHFLGTTTWLRLRRGNKTMITSLDRQADSYVACRRDAEIAEIEKRRAIENLQAKVAKCEFDKRHENLDFCDKYDNQKSTHVNGCKAPTPPPQNSINGLSSSGQNNGPNLQSLLYTQAQLHIANQHATQLLNVSKALLTRLDALESKETQMLQSESRLKNLITDLQQTVDSLNSKIEAHHSSEVTLNSQLSDCKNSKKTSPESTTTIDQDSLGHDNILDIPNPQKSSETSKPVDDVISDGDDDYSKTAEGYVGEHRPGGVDTWGSEMWKKFNSLKQDFNGTELLNAYLEMIQSVQLPNVNQLRQSPAWDTAEVTLSQVGTRISSLMDLFKHSLTRNIPQQKVSSKGDSAPTTGHFGETTSDFLSDATQSLLDVWSRAEATVRGKSAEQKESLVNLLNRMSDQWPSLKSIINEKQSFVNDQLVNLMNGRPGGHNQSPTEDEELTEEMLVIEESDEESPVVEESDELIDGSGSVVLGAEEAMDLHASKLFREEIKQFRDQLKRNDYAAYFQKQQLEDYIGKLKMMQKTEEVVRTDLDYWECQKWWWSSSPPYCDTSDNSETIDRCTNCWKHWEYWQTRAVKSASAAAEEQWILNIKAGRKAIRDDQPQVDWMFERDQKRQANRVKAKQADWLFERDQLREANRGKAKEADWVFERSTGRAAVRESTDPGDKDHFGYGKKKTKHDYEKVGKRRYKKYDEKDKDEDENADDADNMNYYGDGFRRKDHRKNAGFQKQNKYGKPKYSHQDEKQTRGHQTSSNRNYCGNKETRGGQPKNRFMQWAKQKWQKLKDWTSEKRQRKTRNSDHFGRQYEAPCH